MSEESGRKTLFYIIFGIISTITAFLLVYMSNMSLTNISATPASLEEYIVTSRFFYSEDCFAYSEQGRIYPVIDFEKFTDENLRKCYSSGSEKTKGYEITLEIEGEKEAKSVSTANFKGFMRRKLVKDVFIFKDSKIVDGKITVGIQNGAQ